jgi:hypothetical protein
MPLAPQSDSPEAHSLRTCRRIPIVPLHRYPPHRCVCVLNAHAVHMQKILSERCSFRCARLAVAAAVVVQVQKKHSERLAHAAHVRVHKIHPDMVSSNVQSTFSFFASQTLKNLKKKSGEAKDSAIFPFFILLHKRAKPFTPPVASPSLPRALSLWLNRVKDSTNPYSPLTYPLPSARELKPLLPPYPHPPPKARGFIKPLVLPIRPYLNPPSPSPPRELKTPHLLIRINLGQLLDRLGQLLDHGLRFRLLGIGCGLEPLDFVVLDGVLLKAWG